MKFPSSFFSYTQIKAHTIERISGEGVIRLVTDPLLLTVDESPYFLSLPMYSGHHKILDHRHEGWHPFAVHNPVDGLRWSIFSAVGNSCQRNHRMPLADCITRF